MNSYHKIYNLSLKLIVACCFLAFTSSGNSQSVANNNGEFALDEYYFNSAFFKKNKVKSISTSYLRKEPLQTIIPTFAKTELFEIDSNGILISQYFIKKVSPETNDTVVIKYEYEENQLKRIKKINEKEVEISEYFSKDQKPFVIIYGNANNASNSITNPKLNSYEDQRVEYLNYKIIGKQDTLITYKNINQTDFKTILKKQLDSNLRRVTYTSFFDSQQNKTYTYLYDSNQLIKLSIEGDSLLNHHFTFNYNKENELISLSKFDSKENRIIHTKHLVYEDKTRLLQAVLTKHATGSMVIKKFKYIYYE